MKPKILISTPPLVNKTNSYIDALTYSGGECFGGYLPEVEEDGLATYDGLLLCGGPDVHPRYFSEEPGGTEDMDEARDICEMALVEAFVQAKKPILGICRGHQLLNIYFGGTLIQHLPTAELHRDGNDIPHEVVSVAGGVISDLYGERFVVNSAHHQAIGVPGKDIVLTHYSAADYVPEAMAHRTLPILGVQWHPERMCLSRRRSDTVDGLPLVRHFVEMCHPSG